MGIWNYYSKGGKLLHQYDHTTNRIIKNTVPDSINKVCPFLGGFERFVNQYFHLDKDQLEVLSEENSKVVFHLDLRDSIPSFEILSESGNVKFADLVLNLFKEIPNDWIPNYSCTVTTEFKGEHTKTSLLFKFKCK